MADEDWQRIAADYEAARVSSVSLDTMIEWPAQQRMIGAVNGERVLDLGCGSGAKPIAFAQQGAKRVVGVDIADAFLDVPGGLDVEFIVGDLSQVGSLLGDEQFDVVSILQAVGYARDEWALMRELAQILVPGGRLIISRSHPIRFAVERSRAEHMPLGVAYRSTTPFTYAATWGTGTVTHQTFTFAETLQPALDAGFVLEQIEEPEPTDELRRVSPERAAWMDDHVGVVIYRFRNGR